MRHKSPGRLRRLIMTVLQEPDKRCFALKEAGAGGFQPIRGQTLMELTNQGRDVCHIQAAVWRVSCGFHRLLIPRINVDQQLLSSSGRYYFGICMMIIENVVLPHPGLQNSGLCVSVIYVKLK